MIRIIKLKNKDIAKFRRLFVKIFDEGFSYYPKKARFYILKSWTPSKITAKLATENRLFLMAEENGVSLGLLVGKKYLSGLSTILWLGVLKRFRGRGIGKKLIFYWEAWSVAKRATKLRAATTSPENESFYTRLGYRKSAKTWKNDWGMKQIVFLKKSSLLKLRLL